MAAGSSWSDERISALLGLLEQAHPAADTELRWETPIQLLVAVILSAQCTDERVNRVTPELFARFPDARALAGAEQSEIERLIRSTGFFRNKARSIRGACQQIVEQHGGAVPRELEQLTALPGVARKTANLVLGCAYGVATGVVVDTHVKRVAQRLGLSDHSDPHRIERDLMARVPRERWIGLGLRLVLHGRHVCQAREPRCGACTLAPLCPSANSG